MMDKTLVVGGSGFIGRAIQRLVKDAGLEDYYMFTYNEHALVEPELQRMHLNLTNPSMNEVEKLRQFNRAIYVAGGDEFTFIRFATIFRGSLVLLSSMAAATPVDQYSMKKKMEELYAISCKENGNLSRLKIIRLRYAYGRGEREDRLIPMIAKLRKDVEIANGDEEINPLNVDRVADVLIDEEAKLQERKENVTISKLENTEKITINGIVKGLTEDNSAIDDELVEYYEGLVEKYATR